MRKGTAASGRSGTCKQIRASRSLHVSSSMVGLKDAGFK